MEMYRKIDARELLKIYGCEPSTEPKEKADLKINRAQAAETIARGVSKDSSKYGAITPDDLDSLKRTSHHLERRFKFFLNQNIQTDPPLTLLGSKEFIRYADKPDKPRGDFLNLEFTNADIPADATQQQTEDARRSNEKPYLQHPPQYVGSLLFEHTDNNWNLQDRYTQPQYEGQGIGSLLLNAAEKFVQQQADGTKTEQTITADVAQLHVLVWLLNNGYEGDSAEDKAKVEKVLAVDPELFVKTFTFPQNPNWPRENYIFPKGTAEFTHQTALRIVLKKTFKPAVTEVESRGAAIARSVLKSIRQN